jgi:4-carboxymuconolactone decarboxylase
MDEKERYETGLGVRKKVLGEAHVARSLAGRNSFNEEFQEFITRYAWGEIWTRPGLDHRTRRLMVLTLTCGLGRWEEFRLHVRAGLEGGLNPDDIKEVLMQTAIYAGLPAANTGFHHAQEIMKELGYLEA